MLIPNYIGFISILSSNINTRINIMDINSTDPRVVKDSTHFS